MGAVYHARDQKLQIDVALKFLSVVMLDNEEYRARFEREAKTVASVRHHSICLVTDYGISDEGVPFLVMEYLEGESLQARLYRSGRLEPDLAVKIIMQLLDALEVVHGRGIVHRDLKPDNIFMTKDARGELQVKLIDFGIAKLEGGTSTFTVEGRVMGTLNYMSPEQASGEGKRVDARTDIWAVGVILYELLTGQMAFRGVTIPEVVTAIVTKQPERLDSFGLGLPDVFQVVIDRALTKERDERYENVGELAKALEHCLARFYEQRSRALAQDAQPTAAQSVGEAPTLPESSPSAPPSAPTTDDARRPHLRAAPLLGASLVVGAGVVFVLSSFSFDGSDRGSLSRDIDAGLATAPTVADAGVTPANRRSDSSSPASSSPMLDAAQNEIHADAAPSAPDAADTASPVVTEQVEVPIRGLPDGAEVTFNGRRISDGVISGRAGELGVLSVSAPEHRPHSEQLRLAQGLSVDLSSRLHPADPEPEEEPNQALQVEPRRESPPERRARPARAVQPSRHPPASSPRTTPPPTPPARRVVRGGWEGGQGVVRGGWE